ncbi:MAG: sugar nucleotide-binding protein [Acidimicrobiales bacterium]
MKVLVTGAAGPVGSAIESVVPALHGDEVVSAAVDLLDPVAVAGYVERHAPDGIVHSALAPDRERILRDRQYGWRTQVESTRVLADIATRAGIPFVLLSSDWVFDGTQGPASEQTPPNPISLPGFLQAAAEIVTLDRDGAVARVSAVNTARTGPDEPAAGPYGSLDFVAPLVDALEAGRPFTVWEADDLNMIATPSLASMCAEVIRALLADRVSGIAHCCGADAVSRRELALAVVDAFELDGSLLRFGRPPQPAPLALPYDSSLDAAETAKRLDVELPTLAELLGALRRERITGTVTPFVE